MEGKVVFVTVQHLCQVLLSLYGAYFSYIAITKLRGYEETTRKLAKWSKVVEDELYRTQTTQATGAGAVCHFASKPHSTLLCLHRIFADRMQHPNLPRPPVRRVQAPEMGAILRITDHAGDGAGGAGNDQELLDTA